MPSVSFPNTSPLEGAHTESTNQRAQDPNAAATEQAAPNQDAAAGAASAPVAGNSQTLQQELIQLDRTLRQMGIQPQTIALFSRMAILRYAKNHDALRMLVEQMQSAAQQLAGRSGASQSPSTNIPSDHQAAANPAPPAVDVSAQHIEQLQVMIAAVQQPAPSAPSRPDSGSTRQKLKA